MYENIANATTFDKLQTLFGKKNVEEVKLNTLGFVVDKCYANKISMIIQCLENIDLFNEQQKENINLLINKYRNV